MIFDFLIEEWLGHLKDDIAHGPATDKRRCATGDPVVTVCVNADGGCIKAEGAAAMEFDTDEEAWEAWQSAFSEYRQGRNGKIYWRIEPHMMSCNCGKSNHVYSRLFIAEK